MAHRLPGEVLITIRKKAWVGTIARQTGGKHAQKKQTGHQGFTLKGHQGFAQKRGEHQWLVAAGRKREEKQWLYSKNSQIYKKDAQGCWDKPKFSRGTGSGSALVDGTRGRKI